MADKGIKKYFFGKIQLESELESLGKLPKQNKNTDLVSSSTSD